MPAVYDNFLNKAKKYYEAARNKDKEAQNKIFDEQEKVVNDTYNKAVKDTKISYEDRHRENAIQKLINQNEIAEDMANMGLSDSGLNRTQQTAVQLSYANNKSSIDRQKQAQLDTFAQSLAAELSTIKQNRISSIAAIDQQYDSAAASSAQEAYKTYQDAETARVKSYYNYLSKAANNTNNSNYIIRNNGGVLSRNFLGTLQQNGVTVTYNTDKDGNRTTTTYFDNNSGKSTKVAATVNPFTLVNNAIKNGNNNNLVDAGNKFGYYSNGYQPKGIDGKTSLDVFEEKAFSINGNTQNVFKGGGKYFVWDGANNEYFEVKKVYLNKTQYQWKEV